MTTIYGCEDGDGDGDDGDGDDGDDGDDVDDGDDDNEYICSNILFAYFYG